MSAIGSARATAAVTAAIPSGQIARSAGSGALRHSRKTRESAASTAASTPSAAWSLGIRVGRQQHGGERDRAGPEEERAGVAQARTGARAGVGVARAQRVGDWFRPGAHARMIGPRARALSRLSR